MDKPIDISTITLRLLFERPLDIPVIQWALFFLIMIFFTVLLYLQTRNDPLDLRWLILDQMHRPSLAKIGQTTALVVSTWGFVYLTMRGQLTEAYFIGYMAVWSGSTALEAYMTKESRRPRRRDDASDYRAGSPEFDRPSNPYDDDRSN